MVPRSSHPRDGRRVKVKPQGEIQGAFSLFLVTRLLLSLLCWVFVTLHQLSIGHIVITLRCFLLSCFLSHLLTFLCPNLYHLEKASFKRMISSFCTCKVSSWVVEMFQPNRANRAANRPPSIALLSIMFTQFLFCRLPWYLVSTWCSHPYDPVLQLVSEW